MKKIFYFSSIIILFFLNSVSVISAQTRVDLYHKYIVISEKLNVYKTPQSKKVYKVLLKNDTLITQGIKIVGNRKWIQIDFQNKSGYINSPESIERADGSTAPNSKKKSQFEIPFLTYLLNDLLSFTKISSWIIVIFLLILLIYGILKFQWLDTKINNFRGVIDIKPGSPWYVLLVILIPAATIGCAIFNADTVNGFYNDRFSLLPLNHLGFIDWVLYIVLMLNLFGIIFTLYDSFRRVGFPFALIRIALILILDVITFIVGFFLSIFIVFLIVAIIVLFFLSIGGKVLSETATSTESQKKSFCGACRGQGYINNQACTGCGGKGFNYYN